MYNLTSEQLSFTIALVKAIENKVVECLQDAYAFRNGYADDKYIVDRAFVNTIYTRTKSN